MDTGTNAPSRRRPRCAVSFGRWVAVAVGLAVIWAALDAAAEPYRQARDFREVVRCDRSDGGCLGTEPSLIVGRRTSTSTSTSSDGWWEKTTQYEVTWQRSDGSTQTRAVSSEFHQVAQEGEPAILRLHLGEVVGVEVGGRAERWLPGVAGVLVRWLCLASIGLGLVAWGLLRGRWDDEDRTFAEALFGMLVCCVLVYAVGSAAMFVWVYGG